MDMRITTTHKVIDVTSISPLVSYDAIHESAWHLS